MATRKVAPAKKAPRAPASRPKAAQRTKPAAATNPAQVESDSTLPVGLNPRQRAFVVEYLKDKNATQAYVRAYGVSAKVAESAGPRLYGHVRVTAEIVRLEKQQLAQIQKETGITLERTLREIARVAFFDPRKLFDKDGNPLSLPDLDDDTVAAIAGLDVLEEWQGTGENRTFVGLIKKYKIATKLDGLEKLMKHLGGYKEDHDQAGDAAAKALAGLAVRFVEPGAA